jgi:hypothetical protein
MSVNAAKKENCRRLEQALMEALRPFGEQGVRLLMSQLDEKYHIRFVPPCPTMDQIEAALLDIAGPATAAIVSRMRSYIS